jgi:hypothetical protein
MKYLKPKKKILKTKKRKYENQKKEFKPQKEILKTKNGNIKTQRKQQLIMSRKIGIIIFLHAFSIYRKDRSIQKGKYQTQNIKNINEIKTKKK